MTADGADPGVPRERNFLPGPVGVHPEVAAAQSQLMFSHRGPPFRGLMVELQAGLREVFRTGRGVFVVPASGTGMMEAAIRNGVRRRVLCLVNGSFSARFARIARACGREVEELEVEWGEPHDPGRLQQALEEGRFDAVTVVHSETSTAVLNPVAELARVVRRFDDTLLLVDGVSSVGGAPVEPDAWGLDVLLTASQKALGLPPGLAFAVVSERALERARQLDDRGLYFDFAEMARRLETLETPTTPALSLLLALRVQLRRIRSEGVEARWERHSRMARRVHDWVGSLASGEGARGEILAPEGYRSPTVTCVRLPSRQSGPDVVAEAARRGWLLAPGHGPLKETCIRIGHMGDQEEGALRPLLADLEEILAAR